MTLTNVLALISDRKQKSQQSTQHQAPEVVNLTDYYPFGMVMPGRSYSNEGYRYGFQGQEEDTETGLVNYKYRMHDPRLGRFFAVDPLSPEYPWNSSYAFSENRVIDGVELEGREWYKPLLDYGQLVLNRAIDGMIEYAIMETGNQVRNVMSKTSVKNQVSVTGTWSFGGQIAAEVEGWAGGEVDGGSIVLFTATLGYDAAENNPIWEVSFLNEDGNVVMTQTVELYVPLPEAPIVGVGGGYNRETIKDSEGNISVSEDYFSGVGLAILSAVANANETSDNDETSSVSLTSEVGAGFKGGVISVVDVSITYETGLEYSFENAER